MQIAPEIDGCHVVRLAEDVVDQSQCVDPVPAGQDRGTPLVTCCPPGLQVQQTRDDLEVVFDTMVSLPKQ